MEVREESENALTWGIEGRVRAFWGGGICLHRAACRISIKMQIVAAKGTTHFPLRTSASQLVL